MTSTSTGFQFGDTLTRDEIIAIGDAFQGLLSRTDYKLVGRFLERMANEVAKYGMRDQDRSRDYYQGYLDAVESLRVMPEFYATRKDQLLEQEKEEKAVDRQAMDMVRGTSNTVTGDSTE